MSVHSKAISLIVGPSTFIDVAIGMKEFSFPRCMIIFPFTYILCTIRPYLLSKSIPKRTNPFTLIDSSRFKGIRTLGYSLLIRFVNSRSWYRFSSLIKSKIFRRAQLLLSFDQKPLSSSYMTSNSCLKLNYAFIHFVLRELAFLRIIFSLRKVTWMYRRVLAEFAFYYWDNFIFLFWKVRRCCLGLEGPLW